MDNLQAITKPVAKEVEEFNSLFATILRGHNPDFQSMIDFISGKNGKRIRPLITLLSAGLCGKVNQKSIDYALIIELLHTTTLIHDDVVDNTMERRSRPSVNAKYDNRVAVLLGDYILALAITRAVMAQNLNIMEIIARVARFLADGELTQLINSREIILDETRYFNVIRNKTAVLIAACGEMGAISVGASPETREILRQTGENIGLCFQLRDDIFDYFESGDIGKPTGNDIREGKITLPLLYALKTAPKAKSEEMFRLIETKNYTPENIKLLTAFARENGGIEYAERKMREIKAQIVALLGGFPASEAKNSMLQLVDYVIEREK
ncbi:MAG: polyprenyl synthetase family protein [Dysgonamonadaceae bacterium]|jgi:octaprenyl-diphosphate synthase|nr:polyprenyl synthetase family protein [Dysgonamonadaceae bacterium]